MELPLDRLTPEQRKKRNEELYKKAEKKLQERGHPVYGAKEEDLIQAKIDIKALIQSNNNMAKAIKELQQKHIQTNILIKKITNDVHGIMAYFKEKNPEIYERMSLIAQTKEFLDLGLIDKENGVVEENDTILIRFKVFDNGVLVDDKSEHLLAYTIGSKDLMCEEHFIGKKAGDFIKVKNIFHKHPNAEIINKEVDMHIWIESIKTSRKE